MAGSKLTYGGVALGVIGNGSKLGGALWRWARRTLHPSVIHQEEVAQWLEHNVSPSEVYEFAERSLNPNFTAAGINFLPWTFPGSSLSGITAPAPVKPRPIRVGSLFWPVGASRWATAHFLVTAGQVDKLYPLAYTTEASDVGVKPTPLDLVMDTSLGDQRVTAKMYMLPPRPLVRLGKRVELGTSTSRTGNRDRLYLLTLVDDRYYWWMRNTQQNPVYANYTNWTDLFDIFALQLEQGVDRDAPDGAYIRPHAYSVFGHMYNVLPPLMDAAAWNTGMRVVRSLDGNTKFTNLTSSKTTRDANLALADASYKKQAGDKFHLANDATAIMPRKVRCIFQKWLSSFYPLGGWYYHEEVKSLNEFANFTNYQGHGGEKLFRMRCPANINTVEGQPINVNTLRNLSARVAEDFYNYLIESNQDAVYAGVANWKPEGLHDIEWTWRLDRCNTRIQRAPWNLDPEEMLQSDGTELPLPEPVASVPQPQGCLLSFQTQNFINPGNEGVISFTGAQYITSDFSWSPLNPTRLTLLNGGFRKYLVSASLNWHSGFSPTGNGNLMINAVFHPNGGGNTAHSLGWAGEPRVVGGITYLTVKYDLYILFTTGASLGYFEFFYRNGGSVPWAIGPGVSGGFPYIQITDLQSQGFP